MEILKGVVRKIEIVFRNDAERADGGQRAAVFAAKLVDSVAINDQLPLVAARQIEVAHAWSGGTLLGAFEAFER